MTGVQAARLDPGLPPVSDLSTRPASAGFVYANYVNYYRAGIARIEVFLNYFNLTINILIKIRVKVARYDIDVLLCATYERYAHK